MEFSDIQKLMTAFEKSATRELKIDDQDFHLYLSKNENAAVTPAVQKDAGATMRTRRINRYLNCSRLLRKEIRIVF